MMILAGVVVIAGIALVTGLLIVSEAATRDPGADDEDWPGRG